VLSDDRQSRLIPAGVKRAGLVLFRQEPGGFCSHLKIDLNEANFLQKKTDKIPAPAGKISHLADVRSRLNRL
jgi:hypothetical protein